MTSSRRRFVFTVLAFNLFNSPALAQKVQGQDMRILLETGAFDPLRGPQRIPPALRLASRCGHRPLDRPVSGSLDP